MQHDEAVVDKAENHREMVMAMVRRICWMMMMSMRTRRRNDDLYSADWTSECCVDC